MKAPAMFPRVVGIMFFIKATVEMLVPAFSKTPPRRRSESIPQGMKNIFATQCSYPAIIKIVIGKTMPKTLPIVSFEYCAI